MGSIFNWLRGVLRTAPKFTKSAQAVGPDFTRLAEGDRVLVDGGRLSGPLHVNHRTQVKRGFLAHNDIIGSRPRDVIASNKGELHRVTLPDLDSYIAQTPRKVTPIYATYASLIVSLLDIHVAAPTLSNEGFPPLEILEAGTGHGALTLHLAQAIHAANPAPPSLPPPKAVRPPSDTPQKEAPAPEDVVDVAAWKTYRSSRRAVIHTVEVAPNYSLHAEKMIRGFRRGIYAPHIEFYVAPVGDWISSQADARQKGAGTQVEPFLSYVILDMPASYKQIEGAARMMKDGALIAIFVPSITQIGDCVRQIQEDQIPLEIDRVVELGEGISNGRLWDVRLAKSRAKSKSPAKLEGEDKRTIEDTDTEPITEEPTGEEVEVEPATSTEGEDEKGSFMVCRPKMGKVFHGGGFVGLWRRV